MLSIIIPTTFMHSASFYNEQENVGHSNTGSHLGFHSDWVDWARTRPFWSADMPLQARGKDRFIFDLGGIFKKTGDISRGFLPL